MPYSKGRQSKQPPMYNVMLHNDNVNRKEYVVRVLLKVVDIITAADASAIMEVWQPLCACSLFKCLHRPCGLALLAYQRVVVHVNIC